MTLDDEIAEAQSFSTNPPKNESNTCEWVIIPLLWAAGYARRDIESRMADNAGQYPDYTLLSNVPSATWYLEAKAWNVALEDIHVKQALNYANHNGKRFVVLTNGQAWRLYDNSIQGLLAEKLITHSALQDTVQVTGFLQAVTKTEVLSGGLERFAADMCERKKKEAREHQEQREQAERARRLHERQTELLALLQATLPSQLDDANSALTLLITNYLNEQDGFEEITPQTLSRWFTENLSHPLRDRNEQVITTVTRDVSRPLVGNKVGEKSLNLKMIQGIPIDGKNVKLVALRLPDDTQVAISTWVDFAVQSILWLLQQSRPLPIPFEASNRSRWFLNHLPEHKRPEQRKKFKPISANGKTVYMDSDRSAQMFLNDIYALCLALQIAPEEFRINLR